MRSPIRSLPLVMLLVVPAAWIACSSDRAIYDEGAQVFEAPPEAGLDSCEGLACSRDLRSVLDCTGNVVESAMGEALAALHRRCDEVRYLGSYPRAAGVEGNGSHRGPGAPAVPMSTAGDAEFAAAQDWLAALRSGGHG